MTQVNIWTPLWALPPAVLSRGGLAPQETSVGLWMGLLGTRICATNTCQGRKALDSAQT